MRQNLLLQTCILITGNLRIWCQTCRPCCCACCCSTTRRCKRFCRIVWRDCCRRVRDNARRERAFRSSLAYGACLLVFCSLVEMDERFGGSPPAVAGQIDQLIEPLRMVSSLWLVRGHDDTREES